LGHQDDNPACKADGARDTAQSSPQILRHSHFGPLSTSRVAQSLKFALVQQIHSDLDRMTAIGGHV
jgi:hypothetical protein